MTPQTEKHLALVNYLEGNCSENSMGDFEISAPEIGYVTTVNFDEANVEAMEQIDSFPDHADKITPMSVAIEIAATDIEQLSTRPIGNTDIILSKLFFMFLTHYFTSLIFTYPIFVSYGIIGAKTIKFYYLGLFYPVITFFFIGGVALLLVYPFWLLKKYLHNLD